MTTDLMIDIETLDTAVTAKILSVGLCFFDIGTGEIHHTEEYVVSLNGQENRTMSESTFDWWMGQSNEARRRITDQTKWRLPAMLEHVADHIRQAPDIRVWGNGASFDISILEHALTEHGVQIPWNFRNIRDVRTLVEVGQTITGTDLRSTVTRKGVAHTAADDALWQATVVSKIWKVFA